MRAFWKLTVLAVAGAVPATAGRAQEPDLFAQLDKNSDGAVALDEVPEEKRGLFERLVRVGDKNGDKQLSKEEFAAALKQPEAPREVPGGDAPGRLPSPLDIFGRFDADKDGKISKDEAPDRMKENFDRIDANRDGGITQEELRSAFAALAGRGPQPGQPERRPEGAPERRPEGAPERRPEGAPERRPEGAPPFGPPGGGSPLIRALDANADGEISAEEIAGAAKALATLDKNADGKLTREELGPPPGMLRRPDAAGNPPPGGPNPQQMAEQMLARIGQADANKDGKLSKDEAPDRLKENFDRLDRNADGFIDQEEVREMLNRLREGFRNRPEGARPEGNRPEAAPATTRWRGREEPQ